MIINDNNPSLILANEVKQIAQPLDTLGIIFFNHLRLYREGSFSILTTHADWHKNFLACNMPMKTSLLDLPQGAYLWEDTASPEICALARRDYHMDNLFQFVWPTEQHVDVFAFGSLPDNHHMISFYFNHLDLLQQFSAYFQEKSQELFLQVDRNRLAIPKSMKPDTTQAIFGFSEKDKLLFCNTINNVKRTEQFTERELSCVRLVLQGRSMKEIGRCLHLSPRTVESYLNNVKGKLGVRFKYQVINYFHQLFFVTERA